MKKIVNILLIFTFVLFADINKQEYTALEKSYLIALHEADFKGVKEAVEKGVNINLLSRYSQTPIISVLSKLSSSNSHNSEYFQREKIVNYLIDKGVEINGMQNDSFSWTAIHYAISNSMYSVIDNLLKHKVHTNLKTLDVKEGEPPIFSITSIEKPIEMLEYLLGKKVGTLKDVSLKGDTLLHKAVDGHINLKLVEYLIPKISLENQNKEGRTILLEALMNSGNYSQYSPVSLAEIVEFLVGAGAKVNVPSKSGNTALIMALKFDHSYDTIKLLLEKGADANEAPKSQYKPIVTAAIRYDNKKLLLLLLKYGAKLDERFRGSDSTLLQLSVINRHKENVAYLLENGLAINAKNSDGKTALNLAMEASFSDIIALLKAKGAVATKKEELDKFSKISKEKKKAIALAKSKEIHTIYDAIRLGKNEKVKEFYENNSTLKTKLINLAMNSVKHTNKDSLAYFLNKGLDFYDTDKENYNLLQQSVYFDKLEMIKLLLKKGIKINDFKKDTRSNFDLSAKCSVETFKYLMQHGMKAQKDEAKLIVTNAMYNQNIKLVQYLLSKKYTIKQKMLTNDNFLLKMIKRGDIEVMKILFAQGLDKKHKIDLFDGHSKWSFLFTSLLFEQYELSKFLLGQKDVDLYEKVPGKGDLVSYMARSGDLELLKQYIKKGYGINHVDKKDVFADTLLELAFKKEKPQIIKYLIEHGAILKIDDKKENVMLYATALGYLDIVKILVEKKGFDPYEISNNSNYNRMSLKEIAEDNGHEEVAKYFSKFDLKKRFLTKMEKGKISDKERKYLLLTALDEKEIEVLDKFRDEKDFNNIMLNDFLRKITNIKKPKAFYEALTLVKHYNIAYDKYKVLESILDLNLFKHLLEKWNNKGFLNSEKSYSFLLNLVAYNKFKHVKFLFDKKASAVHHKGYYSLVSHALTSADNKMVKLLLKQKNIDIEEKNQEGLSPLEMAIKEKNREIIKLLLSMNHGLSTNQLLFSAVMSHSTEIFDEMCKTLKVGRRELDESQILMYAVKGSTIPMMENILNRGVDINMLDANKQTLLAYSINRGLVVTKFLVEKGLKVDGKFNQYILHQIASKEDKELIRFLAKHKLELNYEDKGYSTVLSDFIADEKIDFVLLLIELKVNVSEGDISLALKKNLSKEIINILIDNYTYVYEKDMKKRWFPLFPALKYKDDIITKRLIDKGFTNLSYINCYDASLLEVLINGKKSELLKYILTKDRCKHDLKALKNIVEILKKKSEYKKEMDVIASFLKSQVKECKQ